MKVLLLFIHYFCTIQIVEIILNACSKMHGCVMLEFVDNVVYGIEISG
jgi:hypothetical protein